MSKLDHRIPPPVVALACAALAWGLTRLTPALALHLPHRLGIALGVAGAGLALEIWALLHFRRARTTISPLSPHKASAIVRAGPYRFTRNPMYLGMAIQLVAFCLWLANPLALIAVAVFVACITRFQIQPEERAIAAKFGESYARYRSQVRSWL
ncbi:MAG: isoprenylcysteine carboxylmethyltransferase family protein [Xanthomonadaceae bacterium]|nr:isoprenylcysteine carboxylmethyltransferase family protein [Xanthomonadaceae bacterium]